MPYARGGATTAGNIELRCRAHNVYEAELDFGRRDPPLVRDQETAWGSAICRESSEAKLDWILRRNGDFANQPFRAPVKEHLAAKWADGSFDEATTEALAFGRIYFRTAQFGPAEY